MTIRLLFICSGNTCRSPMAEALANRALATKRVEAHVESAGIHAEEGVSPLAVEAMVNRRLDIPRHRARPFRPEMADPFDLILCMTSHYRSEVLRQTSEARGKVFTLPDFLERARETPPRADQTLAQWMGSIRSIPTSDPPGIQDPKPVGTLEAYEATASELDALLEELASMLALLTPSHALDLFLGEYRVRLRREGIPVEGQTAKKKASRGTAREYVVASGDGANLVMRDVRWINGNRNVGVVERNDSPPLYDTIVGRLRVSVDQIEDDLFMELRQARVGHDGRAQRCVAGLQELDEGAGASVASVLRGLGAEVGSKEDLLGTQDQTRGYLCCRFSARAETVPPAVFVLTRIAPVGRGYRGPAS